MVRKPSISARNVLSPSTLGCESVPVARRIITAIGSAERLRTDQGSSSSAAWNSGQSSQNILRGVARLLPTVIPITCAASAASPSTLRSVIRPVKWIALYGENGYRSESGTLFSTIVGQLYTGRTAFRPR